MSVNKILETVVQDIKNHINRYPTYESNYSRERTTRKYLGSERNIRKMYSLYCQECEERNEAKEWFFRKIFHEHFNLALHLSSTAHQR